MRAVRAVALPVFLVVVATACGTADGDSANVQSEQSVASAAGVDAVREVAEAATGELAEAAGEVASTAKRAERNQTPPPAESELPSYDVQPYTPPERDVPEKRSPSTVRQVSLDEWAEIAAQGMARKVEICEPSHILKHVRKYGMKIAHAWGNPTSVEEDPYITDAQMRERYAEGYVAHMQPFWDEHLPVMIVVEQEVEKFTYDPNTRGGTTPPGIHLPNAQIQSLPLYLPIEGHPENAVALVYSGVTVNAGAFDVPIHVGANARHFPASADVARSHRLADENTRLTARWTFEIWPTTAAGRDYWTNPDCKQPVVHAAMTKYEVISEAGVVATFENGGPGDRR